MCNEIILICKHVHMHIRCHHMHTYQSTNKPLQKQYKPLHY